MATGEEVAQICSNAVNASTPQGLGALITTLKEYKPEDFFAYALQEGRKPICLDYVDGRMVKLTINKLSKAYPREKQLWSIDREVDKEYQSWVWKFPTVESLLASVGVS